MFSFDVDVVIEFVRALLALIVLGCVLVAARQRAEVFRGGWKLIVSGFGLLLFATIIDITDNFEQLNRFVVLGDTPTQAVLEKLVGYLGGISLIAVGLIRWIPSLKSIGAMRISDFAVENAASPMLTASPSGQILMANRAACEHLEYSLKELKQMRVWDFDPLTPDSRWPAQWQKIRQLGRVFIETRHVTKTERLLDVEVSAAYIECDGQEYVSASVRDVTKRNRVQEDLRRRHEELARVSRVSTIGEMATGIAHELNQPLAALVNYATVLEATIVSGDVDESRAVRQAQDVREQAMRAAAIVKSIRALAQNTSESRSDVDVNTIVHDVLSLLEPEFQKQSISTLLDLDAGLPMFGVDRVQIEQLLISVLQNAVDAIEAGDSQQGVISVVSQMLSDGELEVRVDDTGEGVSAENLESIFDPHFSTRSDGMGMGLAIGRSVAEAHEGRLTVESELGRGTTVRLILPYLGAE